VKALSVRQPWAWLICMGYKNIENRNRRISFRGTVLVHAGKALYQGIKTDDDLVKLGAKLGVRLPSLDDLERGGVVGAVEMVDCVDDSDSMWFSGPHGIVLRDGRRLPFRACKGMLGLFECAYDLEHLV
jgi:hypothetical protein